jgi:hypothetical protein
VDRRAENLPPPRHAAPSLALAAAGVVALVLVVCLGPAAASSREAVSARAAPPKVIRLVSTNLSFRLVVDKPPAGASPGDTIEATNVLSNVVAQFGLAKGAIVGSDIGRTTNLDAVPMTVNILVRLPKGTLRVRGKSRMVAGARVAPVVSGTGLFKGATGTVTVTPIPHTGDSSNVYRLRY